MQKVLLDTDILEYLPIALAIVDFDGNIHFLSKEFTKLFEYNIKDIPNMKRWEKLAFPNATSNKFSFEKFTSEINKSNTTIPTKNSGTYIIHCRDKSQKEVEISFYIHDNSVFLFFKAFDKALIENENRLSAIFDGAPIIMMLLNEKREILRINKKGIQSFDFNPEDADNIPFGEVVKCINSFDNPKGCGYGAKCNECSIKSAISDTFKNETEHKKVEATIHSIKQDYYIYFYSKVLRNNGSKELLLIIDDITLQKQYETDLKIAKEKAEENDRLKSAFLQNMSHEIRTPLNGILGFSGLLDNQELTHEERKYYIEVIGQSSNQLLSIVDDILSISKLETGQMEVSNEEVNVNSLLQELFIKYNTKTHEQNINLSFYKDLIDKQSIIYCDNYKLRQILENLLSNALKFTQVGHIIFGYVRNNGFLIFYVEDSGIGIKPDHHTKIFERFQQLDFDATRVYGGTGLGLTIAKGNTELLGGKIWLESDIDQGSKFFFSIPYKPVNKDDELKDTLKPIVANINKQTILVAEDEDINFLFIAESLKDFGYNIEHANDGLEAVEYCKKNNNIALILMDIKMPNMDGYMAFDHIRKLYPELPIVAQTAYAMPFDKKKILKMGFTDYLSKPIKPDDLMKTLLKYLPL
jgi:signal transduction histidine kinase/CheY-like chemotaxis protein